MIELLLVAPGLLGPWPRGNQPGFPLPGARNLGRLLAAAQRHPAEASFYAVAAALHGVEPETRGQPPIACLSRLADGGASDKQQWLRLDLVHLEVLQGTPSLGDSGALEIAETESKQLWQVLEPYFHEIGWQVEPLHRTRWYLALGSEPEPARPSLDMAASRYSHGPCPETSAVGPWLTRLTEIQMLLHDSPVNRERERCGQPTINALWPRGGDALPEKVQAAATMVFSSDVVLAGLAAMSREQYSNDLPRDFSSLIRATHGDTSVLVVFDETANALASKDDCRWRVAVQDLDRLWLAPALAAVRSGRLRRLKLWPCNGWVHQMSLPRAWFALLKGGSLCQHM